jgi:hypothetical protein
MRCEHEFDDGAYVLGSLSPAERAAYEKHLATCSFCREAVADIAVLPGLLGRLDPADLDRLMRDVPPPAVRRASTPDLVSAARSNRLKERRRNRWKVTGVALAAACLALVVGGGGGLWCRGAPAPPTPPSAGGGGPAPVIKMTPDNDRVPVSATINIAGAPGGTQVNLLCAMNNGEKSSEAYTIRLMAYGPDGEHEQLGSWIASPGKEFSMSGVTHFTGGMLNRLALERNDGRVLLAYDVP